MKAKIDDHDQLEEIWHQVPADYYQHGVETNMLQRKWHMGKLQVTLGLLKQHAPKKILDVGSASGWFLSELKKRYPNAGCVGVDVYIPAIDYAKKTYPNISFRMADAHKLPFKDNSFDVVVCTEVLEHVVHPEEVISEIERILRPGGIAIVEMDSGNMLFKLVWYWWTNLRHGVWKDSHIHVFNATILERLLKCGTLRVLEKKMFNYSMAVAFVLTKD
ncbi:MAG: class I SAM-dependent methyltransferase [bacterium]|nr:class I SAM-dependent methyltransferase [bacterium]